MKIKIFNEHLCNWERLESDIDNFSERVEIINIQVSVANGKDIKGMLAIVTYCEKPKEEILNLEKDLVYYYECDKCSYPWTYKDGKQEEELVICPVCDSREYRERTITILRTVKKEGKK